MLAIIVAWFPTSELASEATWISCCSFVSADLQTIQYVTINLKIWALTCWPRDLSVCMCCSFSAYICCLATPATILHIHYCTLHIPPPELLRPYCCPTPMSTGCHVMNVMCVMCVLTTVSLCMLGWQQASQDWDWRNSHTYSHSGRIYTGMRYMAYGSVWLEVALFGAAN